MHQPISKSKLRRRAALAWLAFALLLGVGWVVLDDLFALFSKQQTLVVEIPQYCGENADRISSQDYFLIEKEYQYDADTPAGVVISQSPVGGSRRKLSSYNPTCEIRITLLSFDS